MDQPNITLVIVGRDPYPSNPISIPFLKASWDDLPSKSSGCIVIMSIFRDSPAQHFFSPREFAFFALQKHGIVFLNASYHFLGSDTISWKRHHKYVEDAFRVNSPILSRAKNVMLCGAAAKMMTFVTEINEPYFTPVPHPCLRGKYAASNKTKWDTYWSPGALSKYIE